MYYYITSHKGFWRSGGLGYTQDKEEAGIFSIYDFEDQNLDGCTLVSASAINYNLQKIAEGNPINNKEHQTDLAIEYYHNKLQQIREGKNV